MEQHRFFTSHGALSGQRSTTAQAQQRLASDMISHQLMACREVIILGKEVAVTRVDKVSMCRGQSTRM